MPSFSPDFEAYICYLTVAGVGFFTAFRQVNKHLEAIQGKWTMLGSWTLLLAYFVIPVALFYVLDLSGAIHDTSFFAAVVIGVTYDRIMAGGADVVQAPEGISSWWPSFLTWVDKVATQVGAQQSLNEVRMVDHIVSEVLKDEVRVGERARGNGDDTGEPESKLKALMDLAGIHLAHEEPPAQAGAPPTEEQVALENADIPTAESELLALHMALEAEEKLFEEGVLSRTASLERQVRVIFDRVQDFEDFNKRLLDKRILDRATYFWYVQQGRSKVIFGAAALVVLLLGLWGVRTVTSDQMANYYLWRLGKSNTSVLDQHRTQRHLADHLVDPKIGEKVGMELAALLARPELPIERANMAIGLLIRPGVGVEGSTAVPRAICQSLRTPQIDVRTRIQDALLWIARQRDPSFANAALEEWKPSQGDSTIEIERFVVAWETVFPPSSP